LSDDIFYTRSNVGRYYVARYFWRATFCRRYFLRRYYVVLPIFSHIHSFLYEITLKWEIVKQILNQCLWDKSFEILFTKLLITLYLYSYLLLINLFNLFSNFETSKVHLLKITVQIENDLSTSTLTNGAYFICILKWTHSSNNHIKYLKRYSYALCSSKW